MHTQHQQVVQKHQLQLEEAQVTIIVEFLDTITGLVVLVGQEEQQQQVIHLLDFQKEQHIQ